MGVVASYPCNFDDTDRDTVCHCLWQCEPTRAFLTEFERCLKEKSSNCDRLCLTSALILSGDDDKIKTDAGFITFYW